LSDPAALASVRRALEAFCRTCGFDEPAVGEIGLCVNEAMANIIRHAYAGAADRPIELVAAFAEGRVRIRLRDWGDGKDPTWCRGNDDPLTPGGLGLHCMRQLMDSVRFVPQADGMVLEMERHL
jgi:serine/threonine-protein kinase RsbW